MSTSQAAAYVPVALGLPTRPVRWVRALMLLVAPLLAPLFFSWSAVVVFAILHLPLGLAFVIGHHRLFSHHSFVARRPLRYALALLGCLSNQSGPMTWAAAHRAHHGHADADGDPHSPRRGLWWSYLGWLFAHCPDVDEPERLRRRVPDLVTDPGLRFIEWTEPLWQLGLAAGLYFAGRAWDDVGWSWVVWGTGVRLAAVYHPAALVNTFAHGSGYRNFPTRDGSSNFWPILPLAGGDCWHNNHHAWPRSARHGGIRWWEWDLAFTCICLFARLGWASDVRLPDRVLYPARSCARRTASPASILTRVRSDHFNSAVFKGSRQASTLASYAPKPEQNSQ